MTQWFTKLFGRVQPDGPDADPDEGPPTDGSAGHARSANSTRPNNAREDASQTVRIDRSKTATRLSWPARDDGKSSRDPEGETAPRSLQSPDHVDPHEAPTRLVGPAGGRSRRDEPRPEPASGARMPPRDPPPLSRRPQPAADERRGPPSPSNRSPAPSDDMTRLVGPAETESDDPVVGWLVVVQGPGRGRSLEIGAGANSIGRAPGQKLCLDFGDMRISRERHAVLVYDPRSRRFFLQNGEVRNLTYIGNEPVLAPVELAGGETITLGETQLQFVAFCGPQFGWPG
jgi:hypothetical protein